MLAAALLIRSVSFAGVEPDVKLATHVGAPYDAVSISRDVRTLWSIGRFRDVRVETALDDNGADVV